MFSIDKSIPLPSRAFDQRVKYPFHSMDVGDSFAVPVPEGEDLNAAAKRIRTTSAAAARRLGIKLIVGVETTEAGTNLRVWRTA